MDNTIISIFLVLAGLFAIAGAIFNWEWFMARRRARPFVSVLGRTGTRLFYGLLGSGLVVLGILFLSGLLKSQAHGDLDEIAAMYNRGDVEQSRARLLVYVEENPSDALAWTILGHVHQDLGEDAEAVQAYRKAIELDPQAYQAYTGLGVLYRKKRNYDSAMEYYNKAVEINPQYAQAYSSMAIIELKRYQDQRALELAEKAYELDKEDPVIAANLAVVYHYNNRFAERDRMYEESRKLGYDKLEMLERIFSGEVTLRD